MVSLAPPDLWKLALEQQQFGADQLAEAVEREASRGPLDFRTRLLIRDSLQALGQTWGESRLGQWIDGSPQRHVMNGILRDGLGPPGFPSLRDRIMEPTTSNTVLQLLRELGESLSMPTRIVIGGSVALILSNVLSRRTEDIDVVDELPVQIRSEHALLESLAKRYALRLTHFQSRYLPAGWERRLWRLDQFGRLEVQVVDPVDIFVGKLFSGREKDRDDLRALLGKWNKETIVRRLGDSAGAFLKDPALRQQGEKNWYILHGETLPG